MLSAFFWLFGTVTAPMTEVIGIYGLSTDAMQPHSNCLMVSRSHVPSFTRWPSHRNLLLRVQVQSLIDLPESILLLVAKIRQKCIALLGYIGIPWSESNRHGLYHANELAGISPAFVLKICQLNEGRYFVMRNLKTKRTTKKR